MSLLHSLRQHTRHPVIFQLIVLFVFFLPLKFFELPSIGFGFAINLPRVFILLAVAAFMVHIALDPKYWNKFNAGTFSNPYVPLLALYFLFSIFYYYISLIVGKNVLFGSEDFITRSWLGRPIAQFVSFLTYGVIPFYFVKKYATETALSRIIERTIVICTLLLVYYGFLQQICVYFGVPITGMTAYYIHQTAGIRIGEMSFMRFYSFGGEPRELGGFIIGALFFYIYHRYGRITIFSKLNIFLIFVGFLLTFSTSSFLTAALSLVVISFDTLFHQNVKIKLRYPFFFILTIVLLLQTSFFSIIGARTVRYLEVFQSRIEGKSGQGYILASQSANFVIIPYLMQITRESPLHIFFGYGYGNFLTATSDILRDFFGFDIIQNTKFGDTNSYLIKIFIEGGIIGMLIYIMIFLHTLWSSNKLLFFYKKNNNRYEYFRMFFLKWTFIIFFVSNSIQISFYYFIIMGLIIGKLNGVVRVIGSKAQESERLLSQPILR